ncbi:M20/M25/M40 family metallo-hydrolase [Fulvivirga sp. RKSG066]|uniref:M20/M25/M40 family metallo-hydrolase n=1 Tax=Fulvivirga aurantia TaxID=2529383 RepID=UPI0012BB793F|nr:M20/M25/M40 family metallo-hydrolase [Fulvivirga aurantia]MTI22146.1 M20/M25/M40 family metallo-hydrolase [Fulvivirga aurantia]
MQLLHDLCQIHAPSGEEVHVKNFLIDYVKSNQESWVRQPEIIEGDELQDCLILKFGNPKTAIFAHMDSVGFTVRYQNQLVPIGGPDVQTGYKLVGEDSLSLIECELEVSKDNQLFYKFGRAIDTGTSLTFKCDYQEDEEYVTSCYLDNRLGIYNALKVAETLENGVIVFSAWEEHGGGSVPYLGKYVFEKWGVKQALISDITWVTDGVHPGEGVVISLRDHSIPRKSFIDKVRTIAQESGVDFQLEVESSGSSDGRELQHSPYPFDWCFIGAPEQNVHSPEETVHKKDILSMVDLYKELMAHL